MSKPRIFSLPGWQNSGPEHWQSRWQHLHGDLRVEQADWNWPLRGDWMSRLEEAVLTEAAPVWLIAHSLGCHLVAAWAAHSRLKDRVHGALLVAPPDLTRPDLPPQLQGWRAVPAGPLPFPTLALVSENDPFCALSAAQTLSAAWRSDLHIVGRCGHLNAASGLGDWPAGRALFNQWASGISTEGPGQKSKPVSKH